MRGTDICILRNFCMNGSNASAGSVVVYDKIVGSHDAVIAFHQISNGLTGFRITGRTDQRRKRIPGDSDTGPHDDGGNDDSDKTIHI